MGETMQELQAMLDEIHQAGLRCGIWETKLGWACSIAKPVYLQDDPEEYSSYICEGLGITLFDAVREAWVVWKNSL